MATVKTQEDLQELLRPPEMLVSTRWASILLTIFVSVGFGFAMPLFYPLASLTFWVQFVSDKYAILYLLRPPKRNQGRCCLFASKLIPGSVPIHCLLAIAMLAQASSSSSTCKRGICRNSFMAKIFSPDTIPIALALLLSVLILLVLFVPLTPGRHSAWYKVIQRGQGTGCCSQSTKNEEDNEDNPSLSDAMAAWRTQHERDPASLPWWTPSFRDGPYEIGAHPDFQEALGFAQDTGLFTDLPAAGVSSSS